MLGVQRQEEDLAELAQRLNLDVVGDFVDNDISASEFARKTRPAYQRLLDDARAGKFEVILAATSGRLTRQPREFEDLIELSTRHGVEFRYVSSPSFDLSTADGQQVARMLAAADAAEAKRISERVRRALRQKAERGEPTTGGHRPFGYRRIFEGQPPNRHLVREELEPEEAALIREAARRILDEGATVTGICREWNDAGIKTTQGNPWYPLTLRRTLTSLRVSGRRGHKGAMIGNAQWPEIISVEMSDQLRALFSDPVRRRHAPGGVRKYLLSGLALCGVEGCGLPLIAHPSNKTPSYACVVPGKHAHLRVQGEPLDTYIKEACLDYLGEFVNLAAALGPGEEDAERAVEAEKWQALSTYRRRLKEADAAFYVTGKLPEDRYRLVAGDLEKSIERVTAELEKIQVGKGKVALPTTMAAARNRWDDRGIEWRMSFVRALTVKIVVLPALVRGRPTFDPRRVDITWRKPGS
jgi:DNA invertase Pin-like site-specific DNA recombinase